MKSYHICAYVFNADIMCCDCVASWAEKELKNLGDTIEEINEVASLGPGYDSGVFGWRSESLLYELADIWKVNYLDPYSYDSDEFPKVVFADQIESRERCGNCGERIYE